MKATPAVDFEGALSISIIEWRRESGNCYKNSICLIKFNAFANKKTQILNSNFIYK